MGLTRGWSQAAKSVAGSAQTLMEKFSEKNGVRIWRLSDDLESKDHLGTHNLDTLLSGCEFFYSLVRLFSIGYSRQGIR